MKLFEECLTNAFKTVSIDDLAIKEKQHQAIWCVFEGKDDFVWLHTGYGKSMYYKCLTFVVDLKMDRHQHETERSVLLVISPLVSLMIDQVSSQRSRGVSAAILSS